MIEVVPIIDSSKGDEILKESPINPTPSWADIIRGNRTHGNGIMLEYIKPGMEVEITDDEWEEGAKIWRFPAVAKIINLGRRMLRFSNGQLLTGRSVFPESLNCSQDCISLNFTQMSKE